MYLFDKDLSQQLVVVAEIGVNHEGDPDAALRMLRLAAEAGANAVKFQTYTPSRYAAADDPERLARVSRFALPLATLEALKIEGERLGVVVFSTPLTEDMVDPLAALFPVLKIASGDLTFEPLVRAAARTARPLIVSTGMATPAEIDRTIGWISEERGRENLDQDVVLMHCVSAYPTPPAEANLLSIPFLRERYKVNVGYSNHVPGVEACLAAVALGASAIEVHFTDQREGRVFRDHHLSLEPDELRQLVQSAAIVRQCLGVSGKPVSSSEQPGRITSRKGVIAARALAAGTVLGPDDLMYARPATAFTSNELPALIGRPINRDLAAGHVVPREAVVGLPSSLGLSDRDNG